MPCAWAHACWTARLPILNALRMGARMLDGASLTRPVPCAWPRRIEKSTLCMLPEGMWRGQGNTHHACRCSAPPLVVGMPRQQQ
eukprot:357828-Chlamydomonas_euryale.AAC.2